MVLVLWKWVGRLGPLKSNGAKTNTGILRCAQNDDAKTNKEVQRVPVGLKRRSEVSEKWDEQGLEIGETVPHEKDDAAPHC